MDRNRYYSEIELNETLVSKARTVTEADVVNYAGVSGDFHPYHTDSTYANESDFGGRIAHGLLILSVAAALEAAENEHAFLYGFESVRFIAPTMLGDTIQVESEVIEKTEHSQDFGIITKEFDVKNQNDETVLACEKLIMVECNPEA